MVGKRNFGKANQRSRRKQFEYQGLGDQDKVRLICLQPSQDPAAPIECLLTHASLQPESKTYEQYEALSYFWGNNSTKSEFITLNGCDFKVTPNLKQALEALRLAHEIRHLWVDAVCINQANIREVNLEVLRMRQIYEGATRVVIWLGRDDETTALAIKHLNYLNEQWEHIRLGTLSVKLSHMIHTAWKGIGVILRSFTRQLQYCIVTLFWLLVGFSIGFTGYLGAASCVFLAIMMALTLPKVINEMIQADMGHETPSKDVLSAIENLFRRPWFTRVWVIQEAAVAREGVVICGKYSIPWKSFCGACQEIHRIVFEGSWKRSAYLDSGFQRPYYMVEALNVEGLKPTFAATKRSFYVLLCWFNCFSASDAHDKAYALAGLAVDVQGPRPGAPAFRPRYDLGLAKSYIEVAKFIIESSGNLGIIGACLGRQTLSGLPSWVPDWSVAAMRDTRGVVFNKVYSLPTNPSSVVAKFHAGHALEVWGFKIGQVSGKLQERRRLTNTPYMMKLMKSVPPILGKLVFKLCQGFLSICCWLFDDEIRFKIWLDAIGELGQLDDEQLSILEGPSTELFPDQAKLYKFHWKPSYIPKEETIHALHNLVSPGNTWADNIRPRDTICLMVGAVQPVILRKNGPFWILKGTCYFGIVEDRMIWQHVVDRHAHGQIEPQSFLIK